MGFVAKLFGQLAKRPHISASGSLASFGDFFLGDLAEKASRFGKLKVHYCMVVLAVQGYESVDFLAFSPQRRSPGRADQLAFSRRRKPRWKALGKCKVGGMVNKVQRTVCMVVGTQCFMEFESSPVCLLIRK